MICGKDYEDATFSRDLAILIYRVNAQWGPAVVPSKARDGAVKLVFDPLEFGQM